MLPALHMLLLLVTSTSAMMFESLSPDPDERGEGAAASSSAGVDDFTTALQERKDLEEKQHAADALRQQLEEALGDNAEAFLARDQVQEEIAGLRATNAALLRLAVRENVGLREVTAGLRKINAGLTDDIVRFQRTNAGL